MTRQYDIQYINTYVSGSTAYATERFAPRKEATLPKPRRAKKMIIAIDPVAIMGILVAAVLMVMLLVGWINLDRANREAAQMENYAMSLQAENARLEQIYENGYDLEQVREIAIAMGMVDISQVEHVQVEVVEPEVPREPTAWETFCTFLTGLFA